VKFKNQGNEHFWYPVFHVPHDGWRFPPELVKIVVKRYTEAGFSIAVNYPYSGCYIPNAVWNGRSSCDCIGIMLEHHKRIYCDDQRRPIPEKIAQIRNIIRQIITDCVELRRQ